MTTLVFDGSHLLHRVKFIATNNYKNAIQKLGPDATADQIGETFAKIMSSKALCWLTMRSVIPQCEHYKPTNIYMLWDDGACTYRSKMFDQYKADRGSDEPVTETDALIYEQFAKARNYLHDRLPSIGITSIKVPGAEADDWGYYVASLYDRGVHITDDKDWRLNLKPGWTLHRPIQVTAKKEVPLTYEAFDREENSVDGREHRDPRTVYLYKKACFGGKDNLVRMDTEARAAQMVRHLLGWPGVMAPGVLETLTSKQELLAKNLKLADTDWLVNRTAELDFTPSEIHDQELARVRIRDKDAFMRMAAELNLFTHIGRWHSVSESLHELI